MIHLVTAMSANEPDSTALISPWSAASVVTAQPPLRIGVMASGSGSNFEAIATAIEQNALNGQLNLLIYNNPGAKVAARAHRLGVPTVLLDHRTFESREALDDAIVAALRDADVEWVVMAG